MKKILSLILLCCIAFSVMAGCAKTPEETEAGDETSSEIPMTPEESGEASSAISDAPETPETEQPGSDGPDETAAPHTEEEKADDITKTAIPPETTPVEKLALYSMDLDDFYIFLEAPAEATLQKAAKETLIFPGAPVFDHDFGQDRYAFGYRIFAIDSDALLAFTAPENLKRVMKEHGITVSVKSRSLVFEKDEIGWFLFIRGEEENAYIVFERKYTDDCPFLTYEMVCYREADFRAKYEEKSCRLIVDGKDISDTAAVRLNALSIDLPLLAIFRALDYRITWNTETEAVISGEGKTFKFDKKHGTLFCEIDGVNVDVLLPAPGVMGRRSDLGDDILISDNILRSLIHILDREIYCDRDAGIISIAKK